jgi:hypothetical protein
LECARRDEPDLAVDAVRKRLGQFGVAGVSARSMPRASSRCFARRKWERDGPARVKWERDGPSRAGKLQQQRIGLLSGGQKSRVAFCKARAKRNDATHRAATRRGAVQRSALHHRRSEWRATAVGCACAALWRMRLY